MEWLGTLETMLGPAWPVVWTLAKIVAIVAPLMLCVAYLTLAERKVIGWMQIRRGPNRVTFFGIPWLGGLAQPIADGDADSGHTDKHPSVAVDGQTDRAPHAGVPGQPLEARLRAARQVFMVDKEVLEQLEARGATGQRGGRTADAPNRNRAERVPGQWIPWHPSRVPCV